jgi:hypothetical protein
VKAPLPFPDGGPGVGMTRTDAATAPVKVDRGTHRIIRVLAVVENTSNVEIVRKAVALLASDWVWFEGWPVRRKES